MKVPISAQNTPEIWQLGEPAPNLEIEVDETFVTADGQLWLQGNGLYLSQPCELTGGNILYLPSIELDSTEDALDNQMATYSAYLRQPNQERIPFLLNFPVAPLPLNTSSTTWPRIRIHKRRGVVGRRGETYTKQEIENLIAQMVATYLKADMLTVGGTALTRDPVDPLFPIAVGANDPFILGLLGGEATMVDGVIVVPSTSVEPSSRPFAFSLSEGAGGPFYVPPADIVPGVSFTVRSRNAGDNGLIGWRL